MLTDKLQFSVQIPLVFKKGLDAQSANNLMLSPIINNSNIAIYPISREEASVGYLYEGIWEMFSDDDYVRMAKNAWHRWFRQEEALGTIILGKSVLDAGCGGGGNVLMSLLAGASSVTGVDVSEKALVHTKRIIKKSNLRKFQKLICTVQVYSPYHLRVTPLM